MPREFPGFDEVEAAGSRFNSNAAAVPDRQDVSGVVAGQVSGLAWGTETLSVRRQSSDIDALARGWWKAFESADSALRVAGPYLSGKELGERRSRLAEERSKVARLLESLARDLQADGSFVRRLAVRARLVQLDAVVRTQRARQARPFGRRDPRCSSVPSS